MIARWYRATVAGVTARSPRSIRDRWPSETPMRATWASDTSAARRAARSSDPVAIHPPDCAARKLRRDSVVTALSTITDCGDRSRGGCRYASPRPARPADCQPMTEVRSMTTEPTPVHVPHRPGWRCRACEAEWPCVRRKDELVRDAHRNVAVLDVPDDGVLPLCGQGHAQGPRLRSVAAIHRLGAATRGRVGRASAVPSISSVHCGRGTT